MEIPDKKETLKFYGVNDTPPFVMTVICGFQHCMLMFGSTLAIPYILSGAVCMTPDDPSKGRLVSTIFLVSGLVTLLQSIMGVRLPIIQGGTYIFLIPTFAILKLEKWRCPPAEDIDKMSEEERVDLWQSRIRELQGAIICAGVLQMILGFGGIIGMLAKFITPLAIAPTISLIGLSLVNNAVEISEKHWSMAILTMFLFVLTSQYLNHVNIPIFYWEKTKGCTQMKVAVFRMFAVVLSMGIAWMVCGILTATGALEKDSPIRTDLKMRLVYDSPWIQFPYPFQFGWPTFSSESILGMFSAAFTVAVESLGDYYACAKLGGAPPPPTHAVNRGIGTEGIGCVLAGIFGTGNGTTSYSENVGAIGILKIGSRRVVQCSAIFMIILSLLSKIGSFFVTIPDPILGGFFFASFGMVTSVGFALLQHVDMNSSRNLFIFGISLMLGLGVPQYVNRNPESISTGIMTLDQLLTVMLTTSMFIGGTLGFILDNTIPGTKEERGVTKWMEQISNDGTSGTTESEKCYDLPFGMKAIRRWNWTKHVPFLPTYVPPTGSVSNCCKGRAQNGQPIAVKLSILATE